MSGGARVATADGPADEPPPAGPAEEEPDAPEPPGTEEPVAPPPPGLTAQDLIELPALVLGRAAEAWKVMEQLGPARHLDLAAVRRTLLHAVVVGVACGAAGALFFVALELLQHHVLAGWAGYQPVRAQGEILRGPSAAPVFRPWLLLLLPAAGGAAAGLLARWAPEIRGGGTDFLIEAFHERAGIIRWRVAPLKLLASTLTLGTGGAGGREGPTMLLGGAVGSTLSRLLRVSARERRILVIAGAAAGMAAVFRTPLGAALLAAEVLYEEGFETDALIPSVLASVISYSVIISIFGESTLFAHAPRYPFVPEHLPLYILLALTVAGLASLFVATMHAVSSLFGRSRLPLWLRPGIGGLALGVFFLAVTWSSGDRFGPPGLGLGFLGGGYGGAQAAIVGSPLLGEGWHAAGTLFLLGAATLVAASLTIGSGGSAGDFAPSLVIGALFGGAFGRAAALLLEDPRIDPGAFALVGMGAFYGGIAHVPLAALVLVCELAGSYDLLVPLMLAEAVAFVALRRRSLYRAQRPAAGLDRSPDIVPDLLGRTLAGVTVARREVCTFRPATPAREMVRRAAEVAQDTFPVFEGPVLRGLVTSESLRTLSSEGEAVEWAVAADVMQRPIFVRVSDSLAKVARLMIANELRQIPVLEHDGRLAGLLDQSDIASLYLRATAELRRIQGGPASSIPSPPPDDGGRGSGVA